MKISTLTKLLLPVVAISAIVLHGCKHEPYVLPAVQQTGDPDICFERDILPIFQSNCAKSGCHDAASREDGYTLDNYANIVKKGIVPGNPAASKIFKSVTTETGEDFMPKDAPPLSDASISLLRRWIAAGAVDGGACGSSPCDSNIFTYSGAVAPIMQTYCVGCHYGPSVPGGSLTDYASVREAAVNGKMLGDIKHLAGFNPMPQGGNKLSDCQIAQIQKWVDNGAPND